MNEAAKARLRTVLAPKSVALIGASENPNKIGGRPLAYLSRFGFRGKVYPVNPKRGEVQGFKAYPNLAALPETPEVALIVVPGELAVEGVEECARAGVQVAIVMASGFGETSDAAARANQQRMVELGRASAMRVIGPNSQGLANFACGAVLSFSTMFLEAPPLDGPVAIVSQSGGMSVVPYGLLRGRGIGVRHVHATGNDCDVTAAELASVVAEEPELQLLLLYLESISDAAALVEMARVAQARHLPVVALKAGRTAAGQEAARSHTGALANEDRVVDAFFEQHGIWRVRDMGELVHATDLYLKGWEAGGRRLVAVSNSGAVCVMAADAASAAGMPMAPLSQETRSALAQILPTFATTTNPVDVTAALLTNSRLLSDILPVLARDPAADAFLVGIPVAGQGYDVDAFARDSAAVAAQTGKPLVVSASQPSIAAKFKDAGLPVFATESEAVAALNQYLSHLELMRAAPHPPLCDRMVLMRASATAKMLNEADSLALLESRGLSVVEHRLCRTADEAARASAALGGPSVVKGCSPDVVHKSELGLVRLDLREEEDVRAAFFDIERRLRNQGARFDGVLVAPMVAGRRELMIGARIDPVFGPVVLVGDGGKYVEAMPDVELLMPPFDAARVRRALSHLRIAPLLDGVRGEQPMDVDAFCAAAVAVGRLMTDVDAAVTTLDINPVLVGNRGEGCPAVDAVVYTIA
ncbi:MAG TPA: acetate--CoA ligase family protein [Burkholderiales bacterium]|nr:acetate--CoA ligase family protein [Burkholderiales bacterium]